MSKNKYNRLQGAEWNLVKDNFKLLYAFINEQGHIKGIYSDGENKISHWMTDEEKIEYLDMLRKEVSKNETKI